MSTLKETIEKFEAKQAEIMELHRQLENKKAEYVAELKATFGITDGEPANVIEIIKAIAKVKEMS